MNRFMLTCGLSVALAGAANAAFITDDEPTNDSYFTTTTHIVPVLDANGGWGDGTLLQLNNTLDQDVFKITLALPNTYLLASAAGNSAFSFLYGGAPAPDVTLAVLDLAGNVLASSVETGSDPADIEFFSATGGDYYIVVTGNNGGPISDFIGEDIAEHGQQGSYLFTAATVSFIPAPGAVLLAGAAGVVASRRRRNG